jgi:hypothetical protein
MNQETDKEGRIKIDRAIPHCFNIWQNDTVEVWQGGNQPEKRHLNIVNASGQRILTLYGLTPAVMTELHTELGRALGKAPGATVEHLRQIYEKLAQFFAKPDESPSPHDFS